MENLGAINLEYSENISEETINILEEKFKIVVIYIHKKPIN